MLVSILFEYFLLGVATKILIPTAKQLSKTATKLNNKNILNTKTKNIVNEILSKSIEELSKIYKINTSQAQIVKDQFINLFEENCNVYRAVDLFDGLMYRNIIRNNLQDEEQIFMCENVLITSSLYGIIPTNYPISKHRLDFMQPIKINNQTLKQYWQNEYDKSVENEELIISLLSSEFEEVFSRTQRDRFIKIVFIENKNGILKVHSTISKKARGKFLSEIIKNQITTIEKIKTIEFDGFAFSKAMSAENKLVFVKE